MQWTGEGLIIGLRRHGESSLIVELMAEGRGRCVGLVKGGRAPRLSATLQPGNSVAATWRARLEEHLGHFTLELTRARAAELMADRDRLYLTQILCEHLRLLPERDPHDRLLHYALELLDFGGPLFELATGLARFELVLLDELGFGLDLSSCAATGTSADLTHVSPKSGRAVSRAAAEPYKDRLLALPPFLVSAAPADPQSLRQAFTLTGHFLDLHVWMPRRIDMPTMREAFLERALRDPLRLGA